MIIRENDVVSYKNSQQKLIYLFVGMLSVFIVFLIASYLVSSNALKSKENDSVLLNIAGRQSVLIQQYTREFVRKLILIQVRNSTLKTAEIDTIQISEDRKTYTKNSVAKLKDGVPEQHPTINFAAIQGGIPLPATLIKEEFFESSSDKIIDFHSFSKTKHVFEITNDALINGGMVPLDTNMTAFTSILPTTNIEIINKLKMIELLWTRMQGEFKNLLTIELNSSEYASVYTSTFNCTTRIVDTMDSVVHLMQKDSQQRLDKVRTLQTFIHIFMGILFCFIIVSVYLKIVRPLESQRETLEMQREGLRSLNLELSKALDRDKRQNWLRIGLAGLNDRMRGAEDTTSLSQSIISYLAEYLTVQIGTIYLTEESYSLSLSGSYAIKNDDSLSKKIHFGEGLIGQVALKGKAKIVTRIPKCYREIHSGFAMLSPKNLLIVPFLYENCVKGVIELGSVHAFNNKHLDFVNQVADSIAIAIHTVQSRQYLKDLLVETQAQAEKLQAGNEELVTVNQELERHSHTRQMVRTNSWRLLKGTCDE